MQMTKSGIYRISFWICSNVASTELNITKLSPKRQIVNNRLKQRKICNFHIFARHIHSCMCSYQMFGFFLSIHNMCAIVGFTLPKLPLPSTLWNTRWLRVRCAHLGGATGGGLVPPSTFPSTKNTYLQPRSEYIWRWLKTCTTKEN